MADRPRNVILVGFMGAGKSTVGRLLARRLGLCFVETDDMIVAREGRSIPEIFERDGEARFRGLEAETLDLLETKSGHVISTGGGFPCQPGVMDRLRRLGTVVWLAAEFEAVFERAQRLGGRPMLAGRSPPEARRLFEARKAFYGQAHLAIDSTHLGVDQVVHRVLRHLRASGRWDRAPDGAGPPRPAAMPPPAGTPVRVPGPGA